MTPQYKPEDGVDKYIEEQNNPQFPDMHAGVEILSDYPFPGDTGNHSVKNTLFTEPSAVTEQSKDNRQPLEKKLQKLKKAPFNIGRLDPDMFNAIDWDKRLKGDYPERGITSETPYANDGLGGYSTTNYPEFSNNPYASGGLL